MVKKTLILIMIVTLLVCCLAVPVSASSVFDYEDYMTEEGFDGENTVFTVNYPESFARWSISDLIGSKSNKVIKGSFTAQIGYDDVTYHSGGGTMFEVLFRPLADNYLKLDNIPNGSVIQYNQNFWYKHNALGNHAELLDIRLTVRYYDASLRLLDKQYFYEDRDFYTTKDTSTGSPVLETWVESSIEAEINKPAGAKFVQFWWYITNTLGYYPASPSSAVTTIVMEPTDINVSISTSYLLNQSNQEVADNIEDLEEDVEALPGQVGDEFQDIIDKENQAAEESGNDSAGAIISMVPDESDGFINSIQSLVTSMSYNGTEAKLQIPAITLPAIEGVMPEVKLTGETTCDFGFWVEKIPSDILQLVRILGTIALIIYCFKELYGTISYALTLKGGGNSE